MSTIPFTTQCERTLQAVGIDFLAPLNLRSIRLLNRLARESDEPHLWPYVKAADKAIRWYARVYFPANGGCSNIEYAYGLEGRMSDFVNGVDA